MCRKTKTHLHRRLKPGEVFVSREGLHIKNPSPIHTVRLEIFTLEAEDSANPKGMITNDQSLKKIS